LNSQTDFDFAIRMLGAGGETAYGGARSNVFQVTTSTGQAQINLSSATVQRTRSISSATLLMKTFGSSNLATT